MNAKTNVFLIGLTKISAIYIATIIAMLISQVAAIAYFLVIMTLLITEHKTGYIQNNLPSTPKQLKYLESAALAYKKWADRKIDMARNTKHAKITKKFTRISDLLTIAISSSIPWIVALSVDDDTSFWKHIFYVTLALVIATMTRVSILALQRREFSPANNA
jgi:hypothetical protein